MPLIQLHPTFSVPAALVTGLLAVYAFFGAPMTARAVLWGLHRRHRRRHGTRDKDKTVPGPATGPDPQRVVLALLWAQASLVLAVVAIAPGVGAQEVGLAAPRADRVSLALALAGGIGPGAFIAIRAWQRRRLQLGKPVLTRVTANISGDISGKVSAGVSADAAERGFALAATVSAAICDPLLYFGLGTAAGMGLAGLAGGTAVTVTAAVFVAAHAQRGIFRLVPAAGLAFLLGVCYFETSSLLLPMLLHLIVNLRAVLRALLTGTIDTIDTAARTAARTAVGTAAEAADRLATHPVPPPRNLPTPTATTAKCPSDHYQ